MTDKTVVFNRAIGLVKEYENDGVSGNLVEAMYDCLKGYIRLYNEEYKLLNEPPNKITIDLVVDTEDSLCIKDMKITQEGKTSSYCDNKLDEEMRLGEALSEIREYVLDLK